jgi:hypothetical protein
MKDVVGSSIGSLGPSKLETISVVNELSRMILWLFNDFSQMDTLHRRMTAWLRIKLENPWKEAGAA